MTLDGNHYRRCDVFAPCLQMEEGLKPDGKSSLMMLPTYVIQLPTGCVLQRLCDALRVDLLAAPAAACIHLLPLQPLRS